MGDITCCRVTNEGQSLMERIKALLSNHSLASRVNSEWNQLSEEFEAAYSSMPIKYMDRKELSFHSFVKLLGFLCIDLASLNGDIIEIGVWKGKSLAFMQRLIQSPTKVIGIDPCELDGQRSELASFHQAIFPECTLIIGYSQLPSRRSYNYRGVLSSYILMVATRVKMWMDFLMYERFIIPGGYIVFDDYVDSKYCPEVGPTIDRMRDLGMFKNYYDIGSVPNYENSYLLLKSAA